VVARERERGESQRRERERETSGGDDAGDDP
jgi:hypothetical protein